MGKHNRRKSILKKIPALVFFSLQSLDKLFIDEIVK